MTASIHLGYEVGSGHAVNVPLGHLVVTGQTQKSGKTTTLEALITRSNLKAVAFITKRGEKSFRLMTPIQPYFRERADWQFVQSLFEAALKQPMQYKEAWIMRACEGAKTLEEVQENVQRFIKGEKRVSRGSRGKTKEHWIRKPATGLNGDMYFVLNEYFNQVLPELRRLPSTKTLALRRGVNVMDLSPYSFPMQALVIRSVLEEVYLHQENAIVIIPEAWEFIPEGRRSPVRLAAEELIRKGAAEKNYVWLDSQDIAGVAKMMLRSMEVWILGVQRDAREIKRVVESIPNIGGARAGLAGQIATMGKGQFIVTFGQEVRKVYVQPAGMEEVHAQAIARGEEQAESWAGIVKALDDVQRADDVRSGDERASEDSAGGSAGGPQSVVEHAAGGVPAGEVDGSRGEVAQREESEAEMKLDTLAKALRIPDPENATESDVLAAIGNLVVAHDVMAARIRDSEDAGETVLNVPTNHARQHPAAAASGANPITIDRESLYTWILERLQKEKPGVLLLATQRPELRVKVDRPVLGIDGKTLQGRLARLLHEGFFLETRSGSDVLRECLRRGWVSAGYRTNLLHPHLKELAELGFLTIEENGYQAVKGMKIDVVEEGARAHGAAR